MNIAMTGGTGFLGRHLTGVFTRRGHHVYIYQENREKPNKKCDICSMAGRKRGAERELPPIDVWVNLAGKSIFDRWTDTTKEQIISSRIEATREVRRIMKQQPKNPGL